METERSPPKRAALICLDDNIEMNGEYGTDVHGGNAGTLRFWRQLQLECFVCAAPAQNCAHRASAATLPFNVMISLPATSTS